MLNIQTSNFSTFFICRFDIGWSCYISSTQLSSVTSLLVATMKLSNDGEPGKRSENWAGGRVVGLGDPRWNEDNNGNSIFTWNPKQQFFNGWKWWNNHFLCQNLVHDPTETTIYKWMLQVPGRYSCFWKMGNMHHDQWSLNYSLQQSSKFREFWQLVGIFVAGGWTNSHPTNWAESTNGTTIFLGICDEGIKRIPPRKLTYLLKIDGWKIKFHFKTVPFFRVHVHLCGGVCRTPCLVLWNNISTQLPTPGAGVQPNFHS